MNEAFPVPNTTLEADLLRLLFADAGAGLIVTTSDGRVMRANAAAARLLGLPIRAGATLRDVLGEERWQDLTSARETDRPLREIRNERFRLTWQRLRADDPMSEMLMRISAARATAGLRDLGILHDLGNVFAVIQGSVEAASDGDAAMPSGLVNATRRGREMVRSLLHGEAASCETPAADRSLDAAVKEVRPALVHICGPGLTLELLHGANDARVTIDQGMLERILLNLAANARDAMGGRGVVKVETVQIPGREPGASAGSHAVILLRDEGPGIAPDVLACLGEPFFTTKPAGQGSGVGLATVRDMLAQVGGWLTIDSTPGQGTCVGVHLPVIDGLERVTNAGRGTRGTVLLVEDNESFRVLAAGALVRAGWAVIQAASGEAALELIARGEGGSAPDVLVTDWTLPGMTGEELAVALRAHAGFARHPVLIMTATAVGLAGTADDAATAMLVKPFEMRELRAAVESLVAAAALAGG